MLLTVHKPNRH